MKRIILTTGAALLVAVPAAMGLVGNTSFAQSVPVRVPAQATLVDDTGSEHSGGTAEPGDDKGGQRPASTTEPGDDKGGQRPASTTGAGTGSVSGSGSVSDSGSGKGKNGAHGGSSNRTGGRDDRSGHA